MSSLGDWITIEPTDPTKCWRCGESYRQEREQLSEAELDEHTGLFVTARVFDLCSCPAPFGRKLSHEEVELE